MVQCGKCGTTGLKMREVIPAFIDGKSVLVCRECAHELLGDQEPRIYIKKMK
jgi:hypothetical protein